MYTEITRCRACGWESLLPVLDLGLMPISDFPKPGGDLDYAPLELVRCERCELVQLRHSVNRDRLYKHYYYRSGINESMIAALRDVAEDAMGRVNIEEADAVLDIGCNDGTLLKQYPQWLRREGFDPSNTLPTAWDDGILYWPHYFPPPFGKPHAKGYKIITALAVFYDLDEPGAFLAEARRWLSPDGVLVIQMPDLSTMTRLNAFDNICHEHVAYWPTRTLYDLARLVGLRLIQMDRNDTNGGSLRYTFQRAEPVPDPWEPYPLDSYGREVSEFAWRVAKLKADTVALIYRLRAEGKRVWAYGASTKGSTLLAYYGLGPDLVSAVADRNPEKWGRQTVTGIPIVSEEEFRRASPDYALVLPWGFGPAFEQREAEYLKRGQFIYPLPELRIVGGTHASRESPHSAPEARDRVPAR